MEEPTHYWSGQKPLRRLVPGAWNEHTEVPFGAAFVPTSDELASFGDKITPFEAGPPPPPVPLPTSPLRSGPDGAWTRRRR